MNEKLKKYGPYILLTTFLAFAFITLFTPYYSFDFELTLGISGFGMLKNWSSGAWNVLTNIFQILFFIDMLLLITIAIIGFLQSAGKCRTVKIGKLSLLQILEILIIVCAGLSLLIFFFNIFHVAANSFMWGVGTLFMIIFCTALLVFYEIGIAKGFINEQSVFKKTDRKENVVNVKSTAKTNAGTEEVEISDNYDGE